MTKVDIQQKCKLTDLGNAERLVRQHGENIRYCSAWRKWLGWEGSHWKINDTGQVERMAKETVRTIYTETSSANSTDEREAIAKWAVSSESEFRIRNMITMAETEPGIPVTPDQLDRDPWLLNTPTGTVHLRTGQVREHRPEDLITKLTIAPYVENYDDCDLWKDHLNRIMSGNEKLIRFLQRYIGYCLTGVTTERDMVFAWGEGANGKTVTHETIKAMLGDLCSPNTC